MARMLSRSDRHIYRILAIIGVGLTIAFAVTWFSPSNIPSFENGWLSGVAFVLFILTTYIVWHEVIAGLYSFELLRKIVPYKYKSPQKKIKVAFITTFVPQSEPISMLRRSLTSIKHVDYDHDTWVLDEGNSSQVQDLCDELDVRYFTRKNKKRYNTDGGKYASKTKGGNHNAWYDAFGKTYDIVAQVDTDFVVKRNFLTETLGQFRDPKIAFVGTPQYYGNIDDGLVARGAAEQTYNFYGPMLRGQSGYLSPMMIGANHIVRVSALDSIGGYAAHLTEDLLTGMRLYAAGWKGIYCPKILAVGEAPNTWSDFFSQQMRWAHGGFDVLFRHSWKLLPRMRFYQSLRLFISLQHYFSGINLVMGSMLLVLYFVLGISSANYSLVQALFIYLPLLAWLYLVPLWYSRFNILDKKERGIMLSGKIVDLAAQPVYFMAFLGALVNKKIAFKVTTKGRESNDRVTFRLFRFHILLGLISLAALIIGVLSGRYSYVLVFWAIANVVIGMVFVAIVINSRLRVSIVKTTTQTSE